MSDAYEDDLRRRLDLTFGDDDLNKVLDDTRAIVGPANVPGFLQRAAAARAALKAGEQVDPMALRALEDLLRVRRPALVCLSDGTVTPPNEATKQGFPDWDGFAEAVKDVLPGMARLDLVHWSGEKWHIGSGFLVADDVILTNRHVLRALSGASMQLSRGQAVARFGFTEGSFNSDEVAIAGVVAFSWEADLALLRLGATRPGEQVPTWSDSELSVGHPIVVVGHPADDQRDDHFKGLIYGNRFGQKHASPGLVMRRHPPGNQLDHDCSTLKGNSGSAVFDMRTAKVAGVHYTGAFFEENGAEGVQTARAFVRKHLGGA